MRLVPYITIILFILILFEVWLFYEPSTIEVTIGRWLRIDALGLEPSYLLLLSNSIFAVALFCFGFNVWLFIRKDYVGSFIGSLALLILFLIDPIKEVFQRPRPIFDETIVSITGYSFPSGHALSATVLIGVMGLLYHRAMGLGRVRRSFVYLALLYVLIIGWTRIAIGVHYVSDVVAGYAFGGILLLFLTWTDAALRSRFSGRRNV